MELPPHNYRKIPITPFLLHNLLENVSKPLYFFPRGILYNFFLFWLIYGGFGFGVLGVGSYIGFLGLGISVDGVWGLWYRAFWLFWVGALYIKIKEQPWEKMVHQNPIVEIFSTQLLVNAEIDSLQNCERSWWYWVRHQKLHISFFQKDWDISWPTNWSFNELIKNLQLVFMSRYPKQSYRNTIHS